ncbi:MAG: hypothetical protein FH756_19810 [Firmicutes bacterium]|nr:hypothetical protein [Bacillota bacterium]
MIFLLFNRYREVTDRCLELGAKMDSLANEEGAELRRLLEEQAWLSKTIARQAKGTLEQVGQSLGRIESWINEALAKAEKALDDSGIPSDIFALEDVIVDAVSLRDKAKSLVSDEGMEGLNTAGQVLTYSNSDVCSGGAEIRIDLSENHEDHVEIEKEIEDAAKEVAVASPDPQVSPYPMTYKLPPDLVGSLEKKLFPEKLPKLPNSVPGVNAVEVETPSSKKERKRGKKKKK